MLKVILVSATLSILGVPAVWAGPSAPETLYLNDKSLDSFREFLVSNTRSDANIKISYSGSRFQSHSVGLDDHLMDMGPDLWCNNRWVKSLKVHTGGMEVVIPKMNGTCQIRLGNKPVVQFINDEAYSPVYKRFGAYQEECKYSAEGPMSSNRYRNMSCAQSFDEVSILSDSIESFLVKLEVLLGQKVPKSFIEAQNPYADLDFSKAPKKVRCHLSLYATLSERLFWPGTSQDSKISCSTWNDGEHHWNGIHALGQCDEPVQRADTSFKKYSNSRVQVL